MDLGRSCLSGPGNVQILIYNWPISFHYRLTQKRNPYFQGSQGPTTNGNISHITKFCHMTLAV